MARSSKLTVHAAPGYCHVYREMAGVQDAKGLMALIRIMKVISKEVLNHFKKCSAISPFSKGCSSLRIVDQGTKFPANSRILNSRHKETVSTTSLGREKNVVNNAIWSSKYFRRRK